MAGRPSSYTQATADAICERLMDGDSLIEICEDPAMPGKRTVFQWLAARPDFAHQYACAREVQAHVQAERAVQEATQAKDAQLGRLAYDARRWHASKLLPKVYGDRITQEHTGKDGAGLVVQVVTGVPPRGDT